MQVSSNNKYIAFLRGINVGGHHKVPMAALKIELAKLGFENVITILNSGNIIFDTSLTDTDKLELKITTHLEKHFGFPIPTIIRKTEVLLDLIKADPFKNFTLTKDFHFYISLLKKDVSADLELPWESVDTSFKIIAKNGKNVFSILDRTIAKTPKVMKAMEDFFGKDITTRNWKTVLRIEKKIL